MELIKFNDAMWGDLAVCVLIKNPPPLRGENRERKIAKKKVGMRGKWQ